MPQWRQCLWGLSWEHMQVIVSQVHFNPGISLWLLTTPEILCDLFWNLRLIYRRPLLYPVIKEPLGKTIMTSFRYFCWNVEPLVWASVPGLTSSPPIQPHIPSPQIYTFKIYSHTYFLSSWWSMCVRFCSSFVGYVLYSHNSVSYWPGGKEIVGVSFKENMHRLSLGEDISLVFRDREIVLLQQRKAECFYRAEGFSGIWRFKILRFLNWWSYLIFQVPFFQIRWYEFSSILHLWNHYDRTLSLV